jgi:hypothetical protein
MTAGLYRLLALLGICLGPASTALAATPVGHFAIVVGNNRPEDASRQALHFADDDAVAMHTLLREAGVDSILLARFDDDTAGLRNGVGPDGPPTWTALKAQFDAIVGRMRTATAAGERVEFMLFYSGHGDVERGEGYVSLEDGRLTRERLYSLLVQSPAVRNHVVIDACRSYFMAYERGAGGRREPYTGAFPIPSNPGDLANTGFVLSTSSDRESHEWERYQAGIFTHQVRSALRGAADVDRDGHISYAELGAFLNAANAGITNPRFRPDFLVRPPGQSPGSLDVEIFSWPSGEAVVSLDRPDDGHIFVETAQGERVLDVHPEATQFLSVHLPRERPLFVRRSADDTEYRIDNSGPAVLSGLDPERARETGKGALHYALDQLFASPFGTDTVVSYRNQVRNQLELAQARNEGAPAQSRRSAWLQPTAGWTVVGSAMVGLGLASWATERYETGKNLSQRERAQRNETISTLTLGAAVAGGMAVVAGGLWLTCRMSFEKDATSSTQVAVTPVNDVGQAGAYFTIRGQW